VGRPFDLCTKPALLRRHGKKQQPIEDIVDGRILGLSSIRITTDHISPAGSIKEKAPPATICATIRWRPKDFNQYGNAARQSPGDDARDLRQHSHQEPDGAGCRRRGDGPLSVAQRMSMYERR